jgi:hypothetical protein
VTPDIPITITDTVIQIPIESTCITAIIPITAQLSDCFFSFIAGNNELSEILST